MNRVINVRTGVVHAGKTRSACGAGTCTIGTKRQSRFQATSLGVTCPTCLRRNPALAWPAPIRSTAFGSRKASPADMLGFDHFRSVGFRFGYATVALHIFADGYWEAIMQPVKAPRVVVFGTTRIPLRAMLWQLINKINEVA